MASLKWEEENMETLYSKRLKDAQIEIHHREKTYVLILIIIKKNYLRLLMEI